MSTSAEARRAMSRLQDSPLMQALARIGYAVNGILHILIGGIAVTIAFGASGDAGHSGALAEVAGAPGGIFLLWAIVVGMWSLAVFKLFEAATIRGSGKDAWGQRAKEVGTAIVYLAIGATALTFALGNGGGGGSGGQTLSARILAAPGGMFLLLAVAIGIIAVGVYFAVKGYRRKFLQDIRIPQGKTRDVTVWLGTAGYIAKGIAIVVVGILFGVAALRADPSQATGLDGALKSLAELPFGDAILCAVALGLIAYGAYCFARARYDRL